MAPALTDKQFADFVFNKGFLLNLSEQEKIWLNQHPLIRVGIDTHFAPYQSLDAKGNYVGLETEFLKLIALQLGVKFEFIETDSWTETLNHAKKGDLDLFAYARKTSVPEAYLNFTSAIFSIPVTIIANENDGYIGSLQQLSNKSVAVDQAEGIQEKIAHDFPSIRIIAATSAQEGLKLLAEGKVNAFVGDAANVSFAVKQLGLTQLRLAGQTPYINESKIAVPKNHPELLSILEKAIHNISQNEHDEIINHWMNLQFANNFGINQMLKYGFVACSIFLLFIYWVYRLHCEVKARKISEANLVKLYTNMSLGFALHEAIRDKEGNVIDYRFLEINPAFEKMTGINKENWLGKTAKQVLPDSTNYWIENFVIVDTTGEPRFFENYAPELDKWYVLNSYKASSDHFVVLIQDITQRKKDELAIKDNEERLRICQSYGGIGIWEFDLTNNQQFWSESATSVLGLPVAGFQSWDDFLEIVHPDDRKLLSYATQAHIDHGRKYDIEYRITTSNRQIRWIRSIGRLERDMGGKPLRLRGTIQDITERKGSDEKLRLSARVFFDTHEGIFITDEKANILDVNPSFTEITGFSREEVLGKNPSKLKSGRQDGSFYKEMWKSLLETGHWQGELWNRKKDGELYAELLTISALRDELGKVINYVGLFTDITESKQQQQALEILAHYDPLTKLPNRALFSDRFVQAIAYSKRFDKLLAVCYLDLDGFKQINDTFGHEIGDQLLIEVSKRIKLNLREGDTVCRMGGDEFVLLFENLQSMQQCLDTLNRIHQMMAEPFELSDREVCIAASSGVTIFPLDKAEPDILLRHADQAMYQAKLAGRNCYCLYDHIQQFAQTQHQRFGRFEQALSEIEQALLNDEICVYYQPKVNIKTGEIVGAEALIRWQHPTRGLLLPYDFLTVVEGTTLEIDLGSWVIKQAFQELQSWMDAGFNLQISVNVTAKFLQWPGFFKMLERTLAEYPQISSRQLELEILESSVLEDLISIGEILRQCHTELGVPSALDDFGTGYSSLTHLRHLILNTVKIDQSFVRNMIDDPDDLAIVESVIGLAKAFKREVIAEGVETIEHGVFLISLGCFIAQGNFIAKPMLGIDIPDWIQNYKNQPMWLERGKYQLNAWLTQLELLKLQQQSWLQAIRTCLQSSDDSHVKWPLIGGKKSHLGKWLARIKNQQSYDQRLFDRLEQFHIQQHQLAKQLFESYTEDKNNTEVFRKGLKDLIVLNDEIKQLLQQFEMFG